MSNREIRYRDLSHSKNINNNKNKRFTNENILFKNDLSNYNTCIIYTSSLNEKKALKIKTEIFMIKLIIRVL